MEIRSLKITALDEQGKLGGVLEEKLGEELGKLTDQLAAQVLKEMEPLVKQIQTIVVAKTQDIAPRIKAMVLKQVKPQVEADANAQSQAIKAKVDEILAQIKIPSGSAPGAGGPPPGFALPPGFAPPQGYGPPPGFGPSAFPASVRAMGVSGTPDQSGQAAQMEQQMRAQITAQIEAAIQDINRQYEQKRQEKQRILIDALMPQIQSVIKSEMDQLVPEIQKIIKPHIYTVVPKMNSLVNARIAALIKQYQPLLPPELKKLPGQQAQALLRKEIEADVRPQIEAQVDEEVSSLIDGKITTAIEEMTLQTARTQMDSFTREITDHTASVIDTNPIIPDDKKAAIKSEISAGVQTQTELNRGYLESQIRETSQMQSRNVNRLMMEFVKKELKIALAPPPKAPAKKVIKKPVKVPAKKK